MRKRHRAPPMEVLESVLRRACPVDRMRRILFCPEEEDVEVYPKFLRNAPPGAPDSHPQTKCQIMFLGNMFLVHSKDRAFVEAFVLAGGLRALVAVFRHPNLHLRAQAIETFRQITDEDTFPWHDKDEGEGRRGRAIRLRMFELSKGPLMKSLTLHFDNPFPGASAYCLQILAFFLSYLRHHFCKDNRLHLSAPLLDVLKRWAERDDAGPEEHALAVKLHEDFSRFAAAEEVPTEDRGSAAAAEEEEDLVYEVHDATMVNSAALKGTEGEKLKEKGNAAFKAQMWNEAVKFYSLAIDAPVHESYLLTEAPRRAIYHCNRAAAYIGRAESGGAAGHIDELGQLEGIALGDDGRDPVGLNYKAALHDCDQALEFEGGNLKARYRRAVALKGLGDLEGAEAAAIQALNIAEGDMEAKIESFIKEIKAA